MTYSQGVSNAVGAPHRTGIRNSSQVRFGFILASLVIALFYNTASSAQNTNPIQRPISVVIAPASSTFKFGTNIALGVTVSNTSNRTLSVIRASGSNQGEFLNRVDLRDAQGNAVATTQYYQALTNGKAASTPVASFVPASIQPGESVTENLLLNKLFKITSTGKYQVQVQHLDPLQRKVVRSNTVIVTVTP